MENNTLQNIAGLEQKPDDTPPAQLQQANNRADTDKTAVQTGSLQNDPETRPLSLLQCLLLIIVLAVPIINIVFILRWSFAKGINRNKKSMARAFLIIAVFSLVFYYLGDKMLAGL